MWISPNFRSTDFPPPVTLDQKIRIFEDRTLGWQLAIANIIINGCSSSTGKPEANAIRGSGYAVLNILLSYFEMIAKYKEGYSAATESTRFFKSGVLHVFSGLRDAPADTVDSLLDALYSGCRCGLYHGGMTDSRIVLTGDISAPMAYNHERQQLRINPHLLAPALLTDFSKYIQSLGDPANSELRANFERGFDSS